MTLSKGDLAILFLAFSVSPLRAAPVLASFDDINASAGDVPIASPYQGLNWTNFTAYTATPGFTGFNNGIVSGPNAAYGGGETGGPITPIIGRVSSSTLFDFTSADLGAGYYDNLALTVEGIRGGTTLFSRTVTLNTAGAQAFTFGFDAIDTLQFLSASTATTTDPFACGFFDCTQFTVDDFRFQPSSVTPALPEPGSLILAATALTLVARLRHRRVAASGPFG